MSGKPTVTDIRRELLLTSCSNPAKKWDLNLIPKLTGKVALITGAAGTKSIGFHIAHQLALKGAKVYIGARSLEKAEVAINAIVSGSPSVSKDLLKSFVAELSDLRQVKAACDKFLAHETRLDLLVHNAARLPAPLEIDSNGVSLSIVINHLAPFLITKTLLPLLKATAVHSSDVRVVTLSSQSQADVPGPVKFDAKDSFNYDFGGIDEEVPNYLRYGHSKLANILFAFQLQKKLDSVGADIISLSVHPGGVKTAGAFDYVSRTNSEHLLETAVTPLEGAITPLFAAAAPEVREEKTKYSGAYLMPYGEVSLDDLSEDAKNPALAEELWNTSEKVIAEVFGKY
ncbi:short-chain dehydrogenase [Cyathus striatus]|nr:short-chain dehydrogenase [Cyathus striatus]